jgi:hypothetical protein
MADDKTEPSTLSAAPTTLGYSTTEPEIKTYYMKAEDYEYDSDEIDSDDNQSSLPDCNLAFTPTSLEAKSLASDLKNQKSIPPLKYAEEEDDDDNESVSSNESGFRYVFNAKDKADEKWYNGEYDENIVYESFYKMREYLDEEAARNKVIPKIKNYLKFFKIKNQLIIDFK